LNDGTDQKELRPLQAGVFSAAGVPHSRGPVANRSIALDSVESSAILCAPRQRALRVALFTRPAARVYDAAITDPTECPQMQAKPKSAEQVA